MILLIRFANKITNCFPQKLKSSLFEKHETPTFSKNNFPTKNTFQQNAVIIVYNSNTKQTLNV